MTTKMTPILSTPESVTPLRLTEILHDAGTIQNARVIGLTSSEIGVGQLGDTYRFTIEYDRSEVGAPATIAGKFPARDKAARAAGSQFGVYMTETRFYQQVSAHIHMRVPGCFYAEIDPQSCEFGLLLEDLGPARVADQLTGCTRADALQVMRQAARLHAARFGDSSLWQNDWLKSRRTTYEHLAKDFQKYMDIFRARYDAIFEPEYMRVAAAFSSKFSDFALNNPRAFGLIHGDFRLDNMLFEAKGGMVPLVVLDWQSVAPANPATDIAFFMATSYSLDRRSADERELLSFYHDEMVAQGVKDYSLDSLWQDYRRNAWQAMFTTIFASAVAKRTDRGDQMFMRMGRGAAAQMLEHGTLALA